MRSTTVLILILFFSANLKAQSAEKANAVVASVQPDTTEPSDPAPQVHPVATTYSDAYQTRLKIHKYASYVTLPLFAAEVALGESLYKNPTQTGANNNPFTQLSEPESWACSE